jgi:hypothetical protein
MLKNPKNKPEKDRLDGDLEAVNESSDDEFITGAGKAHKTHRMF